MQREEVRMGVKFKKLTPDIKTITKEETEGLQIIEETKIKGLINYYQKKIKHLEKEKLADDVQMELKFELKAPPETKFKQLPNHRIVVEMKNKIKK